MAQGDDTRIPVINTDYNGNIDGWDLNENVRQIWQAIFALEGRLGQITLRDHLVVSGDVNAEFFAGGNVFAPEGGIFMSSNADGECAFGVNAQRTIDPATGLDVWTCTGGNASNTTTILKMKNGVVSSYANSGLKTGQIFTPTLITDLSASVQNSTNITLADAGVGAALIFDTNNWDTGGFHSLTLNTSRLSIPVAGKYLVGFTLRYTSNATGYRAAWVGVTGGTVRYGNSMVSANATAETELNGSVLLNLVAGDYVEVKSIQTSGAPLDVIAGNAGRPLFWITRQGN